MARRMQHCQPTMPSSISKTSSNLSASAPSNSNSHLIHAPKRTHRHRPQCSKQSSGRKGKETNVNKKDKEMNESSTPHLLSNSIWLKAKHGTDLLPTRTSKDESHGTTTAKCVPIGSSTDIVSITASMPNVTSKTQKSPKPSFSFSAPA
jgi:hypothetical protein